MIKRATGANRNRGWSWPRRDYDIDLSQSFMIGDMTRDVECGRRAGMDGYLFTGGRLDDFVRTIVTERNDRERV